MIKWLSWEENIYCVKHQVYHPDTFNNTGEIPCSDYLQSKPSVLQELEGV